MSEYINKERLSIRILFGKTRARSILIFGVDAYVLSDLKTKSRINMLSGACSLFNKINEWEENIFIKNEVYIHYKSYLHRMSSLQEIYNVAYSSSDHVQVD